ncbi:PLP-dependent aminotransferase family protein [Amycolatopsis keratiniphila]|uniref:Valine-pyruvate aminotransferase n=1 Tax=Amycolatopsis keratiniphila TaxID=129921 RepID=R4TAT4_9PSEU|nr:PLP-dependent aminotransferase family protein [Amycolatopsis keratiniphila]AGM07922.1 valine-pyruvate aminotransferase [Amycolatopsis keratiniphila]
MTSTHAQVPYADRMRGLVPSGIRKALIAANQPGLVSLAGGVPATESLPAERFQAAFAQVLRADPGRFLQYGHTEGYAPLRELIAERTNRFGSTFTADRILVTNGSQQGLDLVGRLLLNPGDKVVVESPSYLGALETFRQYQVGFEVIPSDDEGPDVNALAALLAADRDHRLRLFYTMPNFANPTGVTMSLPRRRALMNVVTRFGIHVLEDDAYGELRYGGSTLPSLASFDTDGLVIYSGSFSKVLSPGLRIGWLASSEALVEPLQSLKERSDLHSATGAQMAVAELLSDGFLDTHVPDLISLYRARRDAMLTELGRGLPAEVRHTRPDGGFFVWCVLPSQLDGGELLARAAAHRVAFVPGAEFHAGGGSPNTVRLSFSGLPPDLVTEAVRRFGAVLADAVALPAVR